MSAIDDYINYVTSVRRYSQRTAVIYSGILREFEAFASGDVIESLTPSIIRSYEVYLLDSKKMDPRTVNQHLSVLSGFCRFLMKDGRLKNNPVRMVSRPKMEKRLPVFYRDDSMREYFSRTEPDVSPETLELIRGRDKLSKEIYSRRLGRLVVSILFSTGIRRSELI